MRRKEVPVAPNPRRSDTLTTERGTLDPGDEFTVKGEGRYTFHYGWNGCEATAWGPVASKEPRWRTFRAAAITRIHRKTTRKLTT